MTDEQLGKELESLISGNVDSVTPPAGTFLAIQDRLGKQDADWSPSRLIKKLLPGEMRLPMFTGMVMKVTAAIVIAIAVVAVVVLQGDDSEQNGVAPAADPTATSVPQAEPTSTLVPTGPTATSAPQVEPTAASAPDPVATSAPEPTATPNPLLDINVQAAIGVLETEFEAIRNSDIDLFLTTCFGQTVIRAGGVNAVKAALEANWPDGGRNISAENIALLSELPGEPSFVILSYDLHENGEFVSAETARIMGSEGNWMSTNLDDCGATATAPEPTATAAPAPTVVTDPIQNPPDLTKLTARQLPDGLNPDLVTERPTEQAVFDLWTEYLKDSIVPVNEVFPNIGNLHLCGDGSVWTATGQNNTNLLLGEPDTWYVERNAAMSSSTWWEVTLTILWGPGSGTTDPEHPLITIKIADGQPEVQYLQATRAFTAYESEFCQAQGG